MLVQGKCQTVLGALELHNELDRRHTWKSSDLHFKINLIYFMHSLLMC